jgi:hypothetical protein
MTSFAIFAGGVKIIPRLRAISIVYVFGKSKSTEYMYHGHDFMLVLEWS